MREVKERPQYYDKISIVASSSIVKEYLLEWLKKNSQ